MEALLSRITSDPEICGGQSCIRGIRIAVSLVLKHLAAGRTSAQILEEFPELEMEDIQASLHYAAWLASGRTVMVPSAA